MMNLRRVYVIQCRSSGHFLTNDLGFAHSLRLAGRAPDIDHAVETAHDALGDDFEVHTFFEIPKVGE
ncbi:MAG: hypothetical protein LLG15_01530 [Betaproteobacteria bacterium]|nr:hypothetical protein [Betaproteobacteria bacterium]